jgi:hypothetical protein
VAAYQYRKQTCGWCKRTRTIRSFAQGETTCRDCQGGQERAAEAGIPVRHGEGARHCPQCGGAKRYSFTDPQRSEFPRNGLGTLHRWCKICNRKRQREIYRENPEPKLARSRMVNELARIDPEVLARRREYQRRSRQRMRNDPKRWAAWLADDRIRRRLKAMDEGRVVRFHPALHAGYGSRDDDAPNRLPEAPLRAWVEAVICREGDFGIERLAESMGIAERQLSGIRNAEYAQRALDLADRMLTYYDRPVEVPGYGTVWRIEDLWPVELGDEELAA